MKFKLLRYYSTDQFIFGMLSSENNKLILSTMENKWNNNEPINSCIPKDRYICKVPDIITKDNLFSIENVTNRKNIKSCLLKNFEQTINGNIMIGMFENFQNINTEQENYLLEVIKNFFEENQIKKFLLFIH